MAGHRFIFVLASYWVTVLIFSSEVSTLPYNITNTCPDITSFENITLLEMDSKSPVGPGNTYYLYKSNQPDLTWCHSYKICKQKGLRLAVLDTKGSQQNIFPLNVSDITKIWIAGRRKDYGSNWTWIDDALTGKAENITIYDSSDTEKDCARDTLTRSGVNEVIADYCTLPKSFICSVDKSLIYSNATKSWYEAMNWCVNKGGRLATWQNFSKRDGNSYWVGLYRKPWLWIESDQDVQPVLSSVWLAPLEGDCMTTIANGSWVATDCDEKLQYALCEEYVSPTTEPSTLETSEDAKTVTKNPWSAEGTWVIVVSVIAAVVVTIIIFGVAFGVTRNRRAKQRNNIRCTEGVNNPVAHDYCEAQEGRIDMNPPESAAYKPENPDYTVSPYAEVQLPQQQFSHPRPEPAYLMVKDVPPSYDAIVYSKVNKHKDRDITLFENTAHQPANDTGIKQAPPKPKRQPHL